MKQSCGAVLPGQAAVPRRRDLCVGLCRPLVSDVAEATRTQVENATDGTEGISTLEGR